MNVHIKTFHPPQTVTTPETSADSGVVPNSSVSVMEKPGTSSNDLDYEDWSDQEIELLDPSKGTDSGEDSSSSETGSSGEEQSEIKEDVDIGE